MISECDACTHRKTALRRVRLYVFMAAIAGFLAGFTIGTMWW